MAIQSPNDSFSANDKRLIALLERLLLESEEETPSTNLRRGEVPLTDAEAHELVTRIDATLESQEFWQAAHLIELLSKGSREAAREVYLAGRARHGFSRIMSSNHYHSFLVRLGFEKAYVPVIEALYY